jgi:predicted ATPase/transcriptional regulator with XRE-family HTH domain
MDAETAQPTFGTWVRTRRRLLDLTQSELGERAGCSAAAIRKIEADERKPSRQLAGLLCRALDISAAEKENFLLAARGIIPDQISRLPDKTILHPNNLPVLLTSTINRTHEHAAVTALLKDKTVHLVTLIGPPGIGKTRLSIHCGYDLLGNFPDGVWFVDLAELSNAGFFIAALARALADLNLPPAPSLPQLVGGLKNKTLLLILDNFEQIVDQAALEVAEILKAVPHCKMLVTSRVPLHIYGEHEFPLPPLAVPPLDADRTAMDLMKYEAVQLFVARIHQHQPDFMITPETAGAVIEINAVLEGIPLALELAAATLRQFSLDELAAMLHERGWVKKIGTPTRDLPQRQRTLDDVIEWSYTLLNTGQKDFFCNLGVLSGWFDGDAAAVAAMSGPRTGGLLNELSNHSLLQREMLHGRAHWRMLEVIHEFARSRLSQPEAVELRRAQYFLEKIRQLRQDEPFALQEEYFQINTANFHGALKWAISAGRAELGWLLASQMEPFWDSLGYFTEGLDLMQQIMLHPGELDALARANSLKIASDLAWQQHDFESALNFARKAAELGRTQGLTREYPLYLNRLGRIYIEQGQFTQAVETLQQAFDLAGRDPTGLNPGVPLAQLGEVALFQGNLDEAKLTFEKALASLPPADDIFLAMAKTDLAEIELARGNYAPARQWLLQALQPARGQIRRSIVFLSALAGYLVLSPEGNNVNAARFYGAIETMCERSGVILGGYYQAVNQQRIRIARQRISAVDWQQAFKAGRKWDKETAFEQAKKELDPASRQ